MRSRRRVIFSSKFDSRKLDEIREKIPIAQELIEGVVGRDIDFPEQVLSMTDKEILEGRGHCEWSEYEQMVHCGGHGLFVKPDKIKINPNMSAEQILANYVHETLHFVLPDVPHDEVRGKTDEVLRAI